MRSIGVLIGLSRRYDSQVAGSGLSPSLEDKKSAAYERQRSPDTDNASDRPVRYDTTAEESPYVTVWVQCSPAGTQVRLLRDIILPRKDGFWRFGKNYSSVKEGPGDNDQDFFWLAPIGAAPVLAQAEPGQGLGEAASRSLTYISPEYFSYREVHQFWGGTYGESESASVRPLSELANGPLRQSGYDDEHPGASLAKILGPDAQRQFKKITEEVGPKDSNGREAEAVPRIDNEDPCVGSSYKTDETDWYLYHVQGRWVASMAMRNMGPGTCDRETDWRPLAVRLPAALVGRDPVSKPWGSVKKAFPDARHAFSSPQGDWIVVLARNQIFFSPVHANSIGKPVASAQIPYGFPVMAQWAVGKYVLLWDQQFSKLPPPNEDFLFTDPIDEPLN